MASRPLQAGETGRIVYFRGIRTNWKKYGYTPVAIVSGPGIKTTLRLPCYEVDGDMSSICFYTTTNPFSKVGVYKVQLWLEKNGPAGVERRKGTIHTIKIDSSL